MAKNSPFLCKAPKAAAGFFPKKLVIYGQFATKTKILQICNSRALRNF
jgi:hypothetical protein